MSRRIHRKPEDFTSPHVAQPIKLPHGGHIAATAAALARLISDEDPEGWEQREKWAREANTARVRQYPEVRT